MCYRALNPCNFAEHPLSDDLVELLILDNNVLDGSDNDSDEPIDLEYVACLRRMRL
jgi:hypothetical protein